jgi:transcriptional regulator with XRE-family HTH domain
VSARTEVRTIREPAPGSFGALLRDWRRRRRYSQLALALEADTSARHLSFLETGRAAPSRKMVYRLAEQLEIPLRERDALLLAAGFAPACRDGVQAHAELEAARQAVALVLTGLEPFPALAVDRYWTLLMSNRAVEVLLPGVSPELLLQPVNVLRLTLHPAGLAPRIVNFREWRLHVLGRLQREVLKTGDPELARLADELLAYAYPGCEATLNGDESGEAPVAVPLRIATAGGVLSLISTTTVFGTATDVSLAELTIECFLPADERTRVALGRGIHGGPVPDAR